MALQMARPIKDAKTGIYRLKTRVPSDIAPKARGRTISIPIGDEIRTAKVGEFVEVSLSTRDPQDAKTRHAKADAAIRIHWDAVRSGPLHLAIKQAVALSGLIYREFVDHFDEDESGTQARLPALVEKLTMASGTGVDGLTKGLTAMVGVGAVDLDALTAITMNRLQFATRFPAKDWYGVLESAFGAAIDNHLAREGLLIDQESRCLLLDHVRDAAADGASRVARNMTGDFTPDPKEARFPPPSAIRKKAAATLTFGSLLDNHFAQLRSTGKGAAERQWRSIFDRFAKFIGHDDAARVTAEDAVRWRDHRLSEGIATKTIRDADFAALRAVFGTAVADLKLSANPMDNVKVKSAERSRERSKGFTDTEAVAILAAASAYAGSEREHSKTVAAKRWVPWICAHTGARVAEVCQLRREDVCTEGETPYIRITPEAGSVKTGRFRDVPVHPQLIEKGFLEFVRKSPTGPLFYRDGTDRKSPKAAARATSGKVCEWARKIVTDERVAPSHGWRHRFSTVATELLEGKNRVLDAVMGHASGTVKDEYGDVTLRARANLIARMPWIGTRG